jgi:hypothetical protein
MQDAAAVRTYSRQAQAAQLAAVLNSVVAEAHLRDLPRTSPAPCVPQLCQAGIHCRTSIRIRKAGDIEPRASNRELRQGGQALKVMDGFRMEFDALGAGRTHLRIGESNNSTRRGALAERAEACDLEPDADPEPEAAAVIARCQNPATTRAEPRRGALPAVSGILA